MAEIAGEPIALPDVLVSRFPELGEVSYRRGGFPLRVGGWFLGQGTVAGITLGNTVFLAAATRLEPELLLHEFRHVQQFSERRMFPFHYIWQSLTRGYYANRYEADARGYAARRLSRPTGQEPDEDA